MEHWAKMGLILLGTLTLIPALLASRTDNATSFYSPTTPPPPPTKINDDDQTKQSFKYIFCDS